MQGSAIPNSAERKSSGSRHGLYLASVVGKCALVMFSAGFMLMAGCTSRPSRVNPVEIDASSASGQAIELYDKDGSGALAGDELNAVPGIKKYLDKYDRDGNQEVTRNEIADRLNDWANQKAGLMGRTYVINLDGRPLAGATVTLVPETYLGENVKPASGTTGPTGLARMTHAEADLPKSANGRAIPGVKGGTYKVQVTHPSRKIPAKYNTATELGDEIAYDINTTDVAITLPLTSQ